MDKFYLGVLSGALAAFIAFLLNGWVTSAFLGYRTRKLLSTDIQDAVRGLREHFPQLKEIEANLQNNEPAFIWDSASRSPVPAHVTTAIYHLGPLETSHCWSFYDAVARLNSIREEYNHSVRALITEQTQSTQFNKIATACLHDLGRHYRDAISVGSQTLLELAHQKSALPSRH
jgi:hypothetical protein